MTDRLQMMVVEDDRDTAEMLTAYFEAQGYDVVSVAWGQDAVRQAQQDQLPDLILLDIRLPDMDGYEVCKRLRAHRRTQNVPVIFLTEKRERSDRLSGLELGAVDYITKPFDIQDLRLRVRNILRRSKYQTLVHPVTGLPYDDLVEERLRVLLLQHNWALLTIKIGGLDAFADRYGFVARDDALRALALMMNNTAAEGQVDSEASFVGQLSDTHFVIISEAAHGTELRERLATRIRQAVHYFYPAKERAPSSEPPPALKFSVGLLTEQNGPYADKDVLKAAGLQSAQLL
ncbi:MAG: response regulator [Thermoflexales bacterium]|nr:response regulator [Thermoflexales bacterium]